VNELSTQRLKTEQKKKSVAGKDQQLLKLAVSPLIEDPLHSRLNLIEIWTLMGDYRRAYHVAHTLALDIKKADKAKLLQMEPKETERLISVTLYLLEKLKMTEQMIDLHESFVNNKDIMTRCNPFSLHYIIQYNKLKP